MRNPLIALGLSVAALSTAPALGQGQSNQASGKTEKKICKSFLNTGSRLNKTKVCKTEAEWTEDRDENAKALREKRGSQGGPQLGNEG